MNVKNLIAAICLGLCFLISATFGETPGPEDDVLNSVETEQLTTESETEEPPGFGAGDYIAMIVDMVLELLEDDEPDSGSSSPGDDLNGDAPDVDAENDSDILN